MKYVALLFGAICMSLSVTAQTTSGNFTVGGQLDKYYPVVFLDGGWLNNTPTILNIGRSDIHRDSIPPNHRGALMATFTFHLTNWGNGANWIDAFIRQNNPKFGNFIANWRDATTSNANRQFLIWLRGSTSYFWNSNYATTVTVYDSTPFVEQVGTGSTTHTSVDTINAIVNQQGYNMGMPLYLGNTGTHFVNGNIGIGTKTTADARLAVNGTINARKMKVVTTGWPDYVFEENYSLLSPEELAAYIRKNKHLPDVPSADSVHRSGLDLGEMNKALMKKVEELTLYMLRQQEQLKEQAEKIGKLEKAVGKK